MSAPQLEVVIGIVHVRLALRTGIWQHPLAVGTARRSPPFADFCVEFERALITDVTHVRSFFYYSGSGL